MKYSLFVAAALSALALSACDRPAAVATPAPVIVTVPGPAGPTGATGMPGSMGNDGAQGEQGKQGQEGVDTIVVVPAPDPQR